MHFFGAWARQAVIEPMAVMYELTKRTPEMLFSESNKNFLFWRLSNECQIVLPALVSGPRNREKPYNKHLISLVFSVRNLQYGAKTRLIRGIYVVWYLCCVVCSFCDVVSSLFCWLHFRYKALVPRLYSLPGTSQTGFKRGPSSCFRVVKD